MKFYADCFHVVDCCGFVITDKKAVLKGHKIYKAKQFSVADLELHAIIIALEFLKLRNGGGMVYTDSINSMLALLTNRDLKNKLNAHMVQRGKKILTASKNIEVVWVPREKNVAGKVAEQFTNGLKNSDLINLLVQRSIK